MTVWPAAVPVFDDGIRKEKKMEKEQPNIELLMNVELPLIARFGTQQMSLEEILNIGPGSMIELDKMADEPVDLLVNNTMIAKGEVVAFEGHYGIKITEIVSPVERVRTFA